MKTYLNLHRLLMLSLGLGALTTGGCGEQGLATTEIKADGSWTRTLKFTSNAALEDQRPTKLEDVFTLPTGAPWATTRSTTKQAITYTARRQLKAGENLSGDVALKLDQTSGLSNRVSVQEIAPGQWQYREVLHLTDPASSASDFKTWDNPVLPENLATLHTLRQTLPPALTSHDNLLELLHTYNRAIVTLLFGPPTPLIAELVGHPDLGELELKQRFGMIVSDELQAKFGNQLTAAQRQTATRQIMNSMLDTAKATAQNKMNLQAPAKKADSGMASNLTFTVQMPGKIISSNGEVNHSTHTTFWGLYPEAAAIGDIVLTATCQVPPTTVSK